MSEEEEMSQLHRTAPLIIEEGVRPPEFESGSSSARKRTRMKKKNKRKRGSRPSSARSSSRPSSARKAVRTPRGVDDRLKKNAAKINKQIEKLEMKFEEVLVDKMRIEKQIQLKDKAIKQTTDKLDKTLLRIHDIKVNITEKEQDLVQLRRENQTRAEVHSLNIMTKERLEKLESSRGKAKRRRKPLTTDRLSKIVQLEDEMKAKSRTMSALQHEIELCATALKQKDDAIKRIEKDIKGMQTKEEEAYKIEARNAELLYQISTLKKELRTLRQINRMKEKTITQLDVQYESWKFLEEAMNDLTKTAGVKEKEIETLLLQLNDIKRSTRKKEEDIDALICNRDDIPIQCLKDDKHFLKKQIGSSQNLRGKMKNSTRKEEKLFEKLKVIWKEFGDALKAVKLNRRVRIGRIGAQTRKSVGRYRPGSMTPRMKRNFNPTKKMPSHLHTLMSKHVQVLKRKKKSLNMLLMEKQACIVNVTDKIRMSEQSRDMEVKDLKEKIVHARRRLGRMKREIRLQEEEFLEQERDLRMQLMANRDYYKSQEGGEDEGEYYGEEEEIEGGEPKAEEKEEAKEEA